MNWVPPYWIVPVGLVVLIYCGVTGRGMTATWDEHRRSHRLFWAGPLGLFLVLVSPTLAWGLGTAVLLLLWTELLYVVVNVGRRRQPVQSEAEAEAVAPRRRRRRRLG